MIFTEGRTHFSRDEAPEMLERALADFVDRGVPDVVVKGANGTWTDAGFERAIARCASLTPKRSLGESLGAGALLQVVLALEELRRTGGERALVAALGWNQQAAAAVIERTAR